MPLNARGKCLAVWKLDKFSVMFDESKSPACNHSHGDASSWTEAIRCSVTSSGHYYCWQTVRHRHIHW